MNRGPHICWAHEIYLNHPRDHVFLVVVVVVSRLTTCPYGRPKTQHHHLRQVPTLYTLIACLRMLNASPCMLMARFIQGDPSEKPDGLGTKCTVFQHVPTMYANAMVMLVSRMHLCKSSIKRI